MTKKDVINFFDGEKCTPRQNPGYAYALLLPAFFLQSATPKQAIICCFDSHLFYTRV